MMRILSFFIFIVFFQIEVRVKAGSSLFENPTGCWMKSVDCTLQSETQSINLKNKSVAMQLAPKTLIFKNTLDEVRFSEGAVRFDLKHGANVQFLHGVVHSDEGSYVIYTQRNNSNKVWIENESVEHLTVRFRSGQSLDLPAGFSVWVQGLNTVGRQDFGMIQPWDFAAHLKLINQFRFESKSKRLALASELKNISTQARPLSSELYQKVIDREIASEKEQASLKQAEIEKAKNQRAALKKYFFERTFSR